MERHYIYSGSLTSAMVDMLLKIPTFEPVDALISQLDRSGVQKMLKYIDRGAIKSLFIDSGAYSIHSQGFEKVAKGRFTTKEEFIDEYIDFVNGIDDKIIAVAQVDTIPGKLGKPKTPEDYVESAEKSWENFLYMYPKLKSPDKLIAVFHQGESFDYLKRMLEWQDENGNRLSYIGISPSNDRGTPERNVYLKEVYHIIEKSSNPNVKTHLFGYTSISGMPKFPWYSVDSTSSRLRPAYNKIFVSGWGTISLSKTRAVSSKNDKMFLEIADEEHLKHLEKIAADYGLTIDQLQNDSAARTVLDMMEIKKYLDEHPYKRENIARQKRLFEID